MITYHFPELLMAHYNVASKRNLPSFEHMANDLGITRNTVRSWLSGLPGYIDPATLASICGALGVQPGDIFKYQSTEVE